MDTNKNTFVSKMEFVEFLRTHKPKDGTYSSIAKLQSIFGLERSHEVKRADFYRVFETNPGLEVSMFETGTPIRAAASGVGVGGSASAADRLRLEIATVEAAGLAAIAAEAEAEEVRKLQAKLAAVKLGTYPFLSPCMLSTCGCLLAVAQCTVHPQHSFTPLATRATGPTPCPHSCYVREPERISTPPRPLSLLLYPRVCVQTS